MPNLHKKLSRTAGDTISSSLAYHLHNPHLLHNLKALAPLGLPGPSLACQLLMLPLFVCPPLASTQLLTNHYERCWKYYCLPTGWANFGITSEEELHLTRKLFWGIFDSLAHKVWAPGGPERSLFGGFGAQSLGSRMKSFGFREGG